MLGTKKAFLSISLLLFFLIFSSLTLNHPLQDSSDFLIIKQIETKKESTYLSFENLLKNSLNNCESNPFVVKEKVVDIFYDFSKQNNFFVYNFFNKKEYVLTRTDLKEFVKVIVYKPTQFTTIKEIHITTSENGLEVIGFFVKNSKYKSKFLIPNNFVIRKVMFC